MHWHLFHFQEGKALEITQKLISSIHIDVEAHRVPSIHRNTSATVRSLGCFVNVNAPEHHLFVNIGGGGFCPASLPCLRARGPRLAPSATLSLTICSPSPLLYEIVWLPLIVLIPLFLPPFGTDLYNSNSNMQIGPNGTFSLSHSFPLYHLSARNVGLRKRF